jgi:hypothetical protein
MDNDLLKKYGISQDFIDYMEPNKRTERMVDLVNNDYIEGKKIAYLPLLAGIGACMVEIHPGAGHNFFYVIDAIHNCYKKNPQAGYDKGYADGLYALISVSSAKVGSLEQLLRILFYQLDKEKDGTAAFKIDIDDMIAKINALICENREVYRKDYAMFDSWMERYKKIAKEEYGLELG